MVTGASAHSVVVVGHRQGADRLRGRVRVRLLVTDLVSHAEAHERARATDLLRLAGFWGDMLAR